MATIKDIKPSISQMSDADAYDLIREIRINRRIVKRKPAKKKLIEVRASKMADKMSPEEAQILLNRIQGEHSSN